MTKEDSYTYCVDTGEEVSIIIAPMNGAAGQKVASAVDGNALGNVGSDTNPVFKFTATKSSAQRHFTVMSFTFVPGDPDDAHFKVAFEGSNGGHFDGQPVLKRRGNHQEPEYTFKVN